MCLVLFIDFVDGTLSESTTQFIKQKELWIISTPDIIRVGSILLFGIISENIYLILVSLMSSIIITRYIPETVDNIKSNQKLDKSFNRLKNVYIGFKTYIPFLHT